MMGDEESEESMGQPTLADLEYQGKKRKTRREIFPQRMNGLSSRSGDMPPQGRLDAQTARWAHCKGAEHLGKSRAFNPANSQLSQFSPP